MWAFRVRNFDLCLGYQDDPHSTTVMYSYRVSWLMKKQAKMSLSTAQAEHVALSRAVEENTWLQWLMTDLGMSDSQTVILEDSQRAIAVAKNPVICSRTKYIGIHYHYIHECVQTGQIQVPVLSNSWYEYWNLDQATDKTKVWSNFRERLGFALLKKNPPNNTHSYISIFVKI